MGAAAAQFQFAAEIVAFLIALAGLALVVLQARLLTSRADTVVALGLGFAALGAGAFVHGSIQPGMVGPPAAVGLRLGAGLLIAVGALGVRRDRSTLGPFVLLLAGGALIAAAGPVALAEQLTAAESLLLAGALLVGSGLAWSSRRSIGARITTTAAATFLLVVVTLSVALSTVLANTVRDDALRRLQTRSASVASAASDSWVTNLADAKLVAASVEGLGLAGGPTPALQDAVDRLSTQFFSNVFVLWVDSSSALAASSPNADVGLGPGVAQAVAGSSLVARTFVTAQPGGTAGVAAGRAVSVATYPAQGPGSDAVTAVAVVVTPLDSTYLASQVRDDASLRVALVSGGRILSSFPAGQAIPPAARTLASSAAEGRTSAPGVVGSDFVAVSAVEGGDGRPVLGVVVDSASSVVDNTRQSLFRTLFLIAFGGSIIAFLLAVTVAERLNRGLGQLTDVARRISTGETNVRSAVTSDDEIGVLGRAFDTMLQSIDDQAEALRDAATEEARLRSRLESVIAGMGEALVAVAAGGTVTDYNQAAEALFGVRRARAIGRPVAGVVDGRFDDGVEMADALTSGRRIVNRTGVVRARRAEVPVAVSVGVLIGEGPEPEGTVAVIRDLRPEREVEQMKSHFLSRVGHELRTPLTAILGYTRLLSSRPVPTEQAQVWHEEIHEQSNRLLRTVEMLEFVAASGANRLGTEREVVSAREVVQDAARRWEERLQGRHRLSTRVGRTARHLEIDRRSVDLAVDELIDNAVKFSPEGTVVLIEATDTGDAIELSVTDQGPGMPIDQIEGAFRDFVQGDPSDTRPHGGLGLGLPLVMRVAEAHSGTVRAGSAGSRGFRVTLVLPSYPRPDERRRGKA